MRKLKLIIAVAGLLGLVSSSVVHAGSFAPGEGLYLGGFAGSATGIVQPKVTVTPDTGAQTGSVVEPGGTFEATEGGLGLMGIEYGGWIGYGYKMGDIYAGIEGEMATGDVEFKLTSSTNVQINATNTAGNAITQVSAKKDL